MINYLAFIFYFPTSIFGLYKMKAAPAIVSLDFIIGFGAYGVGAVLWIYALRQFPLSFAFPFAAGLLIVGTQLTGYFFLEEKLNTQHMVAVGVLILGLLLLIPRSG